MGEKHTILSVEDEPDTTSGVVQKLRSSGIEVVEAKDLVVAEEEVRSRRFDLLLVDQRMPYGESFRQEGGLEFVRAIKSESLGTRNVGTPFAILTAYAYDVAREPLLALDGFVGVISKTSAVIPSLAVSVGHILPWFPKVAEVSAPDFIVDDLVAFEGYEDAHGTLEIVVGAWPKGSKVKIKMEDLPDELRQELDYGIRPVFAWAKVNISAEDESGVRPHHFRLEPEDREREMEFDWKEFGVAE